MAHKQETVAGGNISDDCMRPDHELELTNCSTQKGNDRMEGVLMISNRHSQQVEVASYSRHSSGLAEDTLAASAARLGPKKLESSGLEAFRERRELLTHQEQPDLVGTKLPAELSDTEFQQGMDLCRTTSNLFKLSGISSRTCRICNKQFTSGRALGGHMRVHGPLFTQASASSMRSLYAMNSSQRDDADADDGARVDRKKEEGFTSSVNVDTLDHAGECEDDFSDVPNAPSSAQASSGQNSADKAMTFCNNSVNGGLDVVLHSNGDLDGHAGGAGEEDDLDSFEGRSLSLKSDLIHASIGSDEAKIDQGSPAARKSPLYKLRHNPKRSRWFIEQDFAFEAPKNSPGKNPFPVDAAQGRVCSECGKSFPSERALFGHLRCHPDREYRRGVLLRESSSHEQPAAGNMARHRRKGVLVAEKLMKISQMQIGLDRADDFHMKGAAELDVSMGTQKDTSPRMNAGIRVMDEEALADGRAFQEQDRCINSLGVLSDDLTPARWQTAGRRSRRKVGVISKAGDMEIRETSSSTPEDEPALTSETISLELGSVEEQEIETPDCLILLAEAARKIEEEAELLAISTEKYSHLLNMDVKRSRHHQVDASDLSHEHDDGEYADVPRVQDDPRLVAGDSIIRYECTTCKKSFNSHQALGGHRASHKKTKGCFARTGSTSEASDEHSFDDEQLELNPLHGQEKGTVIKKKKKQQPTQPPVAASAFKGHACSICHRVFLTGQALGGHKRCHWTGEKPSETSASVASTTNKQLSMHSEAQSMVEGGIDLNMPAPMDELDADEVGFVSTDQLHVINSETADEEFEVGRNAGSLDLVLGSSALARAVKDLWKDADTRTPSPQRTKNEAEVRRRFDGIWGQHWPNNIGVTHPQLHQPVYAMESLV